MSSDPGTPTLDQLRFFLTVIEEGSFAAAARCEPRELSSWLLLVAAPERAIALPAKRETNLPLEVNITP